MNKDKLPHDYKKEANILIRHFVIGGNPGEEAIKYAGAKDQIDYYKQILEKIMQWSGLSVDEVEEAIKTSPDTVENTTDIPNYKSLYLEAIERMRQKKS